MEPVVLGPVDPKEKKKREGGRGTGPCPQKASAPQAGEKEKGGKGGNSPGRTLLALKNAHNVAKEKERRRPADVISLFRAGLGPRHKPKRKKEGEGGGKGKTPKRIAMPVVAKKKAPWGGGKRKEEIIGYPRLFPYGGRQEKGKKGGGGERESTCPPCRQSEEEGKGENPAAPTWCW